MPDEKKICPMQLDGPQMSAEVSCACLGEACAWWDVQGGPGDGRCAMLVIAQHVRDINFHRTAVLRGKV